MDLNETNTVHLFKHHGIAGVENFVIVLLCVIMYPPIEALWIAKLLHIRLEVVKKGLMFTVKITIRLSHGQVVRLSLQ